MKKYTSIGDLFIDYRSFYNMSQVKFAEQLDVDLRTIQRWEKNVNLIKSEKEETIVLATLLPYQLIHNLNAAVPIPTFYSFKTKKYSLFKQNNKLPNLKSYSEKIDLVTENIRTIDFEYDVKYLNRFIISKRVNDFDINKPLLKEIIHLLPELNYIYTSETGFYEGHCIVVPIKESVYMQLKNKEITNKEIIAKDVLDYKLEEKPRFYVFDISGDCNETILYIMGKFFRFFRDLQKPYIVGGYTERDDNYELNREVGLNIVWEDVKLQKELDLQYPPRFFEGNFNKLF